MTRSMQPMRRSTMEKSSRMVSLVFIASMGMSMTFLLCTLPHRIEITMETPLPIQSMNVPMELLLDNPHSISQTTLRGSNASTFFHPPLTSLRSTETDSDDSTVLLCMDHQPSVIGDTIKQGSDPSKRLMEHQSADNCGRLRRNWLHNPPLSEHARNIEAHQSDCSLPLATHHFDNTFGLGSHIILWGQAMCNGMETRFRMRSHAPLWLWLDQEHCDMQQEAVVSPLLCYFPSSEDRCSEFQNQQEILGSVDAGAMTTTGGRKLPVDSDSSHKVGELSLEKNITDPRNKADWCGMAKESEESKAALRASSTEYLFQSVSPLVIREAKRQIGVLFPGGVVPEDLVTVHIRWGDKFWEMDLPPIQEYIDGVHSILSHRASNAKANTTNHANVTEANIYLATEDPRAHQEFMDAKPDGWKVYADITLLEINAFRPTKGNRASWAARNTRGRSGLVALASLLVAMEANMFVLTTKSNWSTIMNHLRTNIVDPRCSNCTSMVDLRPGFW